MSSIVYVMILYAVNDSPTTGSSTLSLHDALPISGLAGARSRRCRRPVSRNPAESRSTLRVAWLLHAEIGRDTSELQSHVNLVCRLLLEKKKILSQTASLFIRTH